MVFSKKSKKIRLAIFICVCLFILVFGVCIYGLSLSLLNILAIPYYVSFLAFYRCNIFKIIKWYHIVYILILTVLVSLYMIILAHLIPEICIRWTEIPFAICFLISIHLILKMIDYGANVLFSTALRIKSYKQKFKAIVLIKNFLRITCVLLIAVPYLLSVFSVYWIKFADNLNPGQYGMDYQQAIFKTEEGTKLEGWFIESMITKSKSTVIIVPGYGTTKSCFLSYAMTLTNNGHNILLYDQRGQGDSNGHMHSFGQFESRDVIEAVDFLEHTYPDESKRIFVLGLSQGSAAAITAAAEDKRIRGVIIDSVITEPASFINNITDWLIWPIDKYIGTSTKVFTSALLKYNLFSKTNIYSDISKISPRPLLIFHGSADTISDYEQVKKLYAHAGKPKKLCLIPGAGHTQILLYMGDQYIEEITDVYIESIITQ